MPRSGNKATAGALHAAAPSATLTGPARDDRQQRRSAMEYIGGIIIVVIIAFLIYRAVREGRSEDQE